MIEMLTADMYMHLSAPESELRCSFCILQALCAIPARFRQHLLGFLQNEDFSDHDGKPIPSEQLSLHLQANLRTTKSSYQSIPAEFWDHVGHCIRQHLQVSTAFALCGSEPMLYGNRIHLLGTLLHTRTYRPSEIEAERTW
jgi:hypothetical protein